MVIITAHTASEVHGIGAAITIHGIGTPGDIVHGATGDGMTHGMPGDGMTHGIMEAIGDITAHGTTADGDGTTGTGIIITRITAVGTADGILISMVLDTFTTNRADRDQVTRSSMVRDIRPDRTEYSPQAPHSGEVQL